MSRTLLALSRSHAAGQLDQQMYRRLRLRLIRRLLQTSGEQTQPAAAGGSGADDSGADSVDSTRDYTPTRAMALAGSERRLNSVITTGLWLAGAMVVTVLGMWLLDATRSAAVYNLEGRVSTDASQAASQAEKLTATLTTTTETETPLQHHLARLLSQERWSGVQLEQFSRAWQASTATVLLQIRQDPRYRQLVTLLESQVRVLEALDPEAVDVAITERIRLLEQLLQQILVRGRRVAFPLS
ncbi:MAG: hypothetical protein ACJAWL_001457 [Motiliproteus sp.]|jgi:hypothetical protein